MDEPLQKQFQRSLYSGDAEAVDSLLTKNKLNVHKNLHDADKMDMAGCTFKEGLDLNARLPGSGQTPLVAAILQQNITLVKVLLRHGASVSVQSPWAQPSGWGPMGCKALPVVYPLQVGLKLESLSIISLLLEHGALPRHCQVGLRGLLGLAVAHNAPDLVAQLLSMRDQIKTPTKAPVVVNPNAVLQEPLLQAVVNSRQELVHLLLHAGANPNEEAGGMLPLVAAANCQDIDICKCLIRHGAKVNLRFGVQNILYRDGPLPLAVRMGLEKAVPVLVSFGANVNQMVLTNSGGVCSKKTQFAQIESSLLHLAVQKCNWNITHDLMEAGADLNCQDTAGETPLHLACRNMEKDHIVKLFLSYIQPAKLRENATDDNFPGLLTCANNLCERSRFEHDQRHNSCSYSSCGEVGICTVCELTLNKLLPPGENYCVTSVRANSVLSSNDLDNSIDSNCDEPSEGTEGRTVPSGILNDGAKVPHKFASTAHGVKEEHGNFTYDSKMTENCYHDCRENAECLPSHCYEHDESHLVDFERPLLNVDMKNKEGLTPLHTAAIYNNVSVVKQLLSAKADPNTIHMRHSSPLQDAVRLGNTEVVYALLVYGADPSVLTNQGESLLHLAVQSRCEELVELFIAKSLDINQASRLGETPLMLASRNEGPEICQVLISAGALLNLKDYDQQETALSLSIYFGYEQNAFCLIREGADMNLADKRKTTPLYWAIFNGRVNAIKLLLLAGARLTTAQLATYPRNLSTMRKKPLVEWITNVLTSVRPLQDLCRLQIRQTLNDSAKGKGMLNLVQDLPLPLSMKDYLAYREADAWLDDLESD